MAAPARESRGSRLPVSPMRLEELASIKVLNRGLGLGGVEALDVTGKVEWGKGWASSFSFSSFSFPLTEAPFAKGSDTGEARPAMKAVLESIVRDMKREVNVNRSDALRAKGAGLLSVLVLFFLASEHS